MKKLKRFLGIQKETGERRQHNGTLEKLREMEDLLQRKQTHLESSIKEQILQARKHGMKNKRAALMALKRKRRLEAELTRIDGTLTTIELQREALESAKNNMQVLGVMKDAAKVLQEAQKHVTVDKVLDIMDDVNEQQGIANEIADAVANPIGMSSSVDEDELERELEQLEQEDLDSQLLRVNATDDAAGATDPDPTGFYDKLPPSDHLANVAATGLRLQSGKDETLSSAGVVDPDEKELLELAQWST